MIVKQIFTKRLVCLFILCSIEISLFAQYNEAESSKGKRTIIEGNLPFKGNEASFWITYCSRFDYTWVVDSATSYTTCTNGNFKLVLTIQTPVYVMPAFAGSGALTPGSVFKNRFDPVRYNAMGILVEPGDSIYVEKKYTLDQLNMTKIELPGEVENTPFFNLLQITGKGSQKLQCIAEIIDGTRSIQYPPRSVDLNGKLRFSDSVTAMILHILKKYEHKISSDAATIIKGHYIPMLAEDISEMIIDSRVNIHDKNVQQLFNERVILADKITNPREQALKYAFFYRDIIIKRAMLRCAMDNNVEFTYNENGHGNNKEEYLALEKYIPDVPVKELILGKYVQASLRAEGLNGNGEELAKLFLAKSNPNESYNKGISQYLRYLHSSFEKGSPAVDFRLRDTSRNVVILSNLRGKVVLIDFMFTGCPGCIQIVPALSRVEEIYKDNPDIVFLSISISPDIEGESGWRSGIGQYSVASSIQLCAGGKTLADGYKHRINRDYGITAFPQLVLIDKKGKIITNTAPRPDRDNGAALIKMIEEAIRN